MVLLSLAYGRMGCTKSSEIPGSKPFLSSLTQYCLKGLTAHHNNRKSIDHSSCKNHSAHNNHNDRRNDNQKEESKEEEGVKEEGIDKEVEEADTIGDGAESKKRSEKKRWPKEATFRCANLT